MLSESRSIEGVRLTSLSRQKQHISLSRRGYKSIVSSSIELLSLQILLYLLNEAFFSKSTSQNTRAYRLHFVDVEISAFSLLLRPGVLQTHSVSEWHSDKQTDYCNPRCTCMPRVNNILYMYIYSHQRYLQPKSNTHYSSALHPDANFCIGEVIDKFLD